MNTVTTPDGEFVGPADFARALDVSEKTIRRHLDRDKKDGVQTRLPGAWQDELTGRWFIPTSLLEDPTPATANPPTSADVVRLQPKTVPMHIHEEPEPEVQAPRSSGPLETRFGTIWTFQELADEFDTSIGGVKRLMEAGLIKGEVGHWLSSTADAVFIRAER